VTPDDVRAYIGLGSNAGDRLGSLRDAIAALDATDDVRVLRTSPVYATEPVGPSQPDFLNAVAEIETTLSARGLLGELKRIEAGLGRTSRERWGPREIDLDLLLYGGRVIQEDGLRVPHPELTGRAFVLVPLADLAPDEVVPGAVTVGELLGRLDRSGVRPHEGRLPD
jgi:2-amino-4-hydroxy-6-hydroxymethyldihydropteridine diphosphokinase